MSEMNLIFNFFEIIDPPIFPEQRELMFYKAVHEIGNIQMMTEDGRTFVVQVIGMNTEGDFGAIRLLEEMDVKDSMTITNLLETMQADNSIQNLLNSMDEHNSKKT